MSLNIEFRHNEDELTIEVDSDGNREKIGKKSKKISIDASREVRILGKSSPAKRGGFTAASTLCKRIRTRHIERSMFDKL